MRFSQLVVRSTLLALCAQICTQTWSQELHGLAASLDSATRISDDRARSEAFQQIRASQPVDGRGGAAQADFDSLIELITTTVAPTSWDIVGGPGAISAFPGGVYINADGVLKNLDNRRLKPVLERLSALRNVQLNQDDVRASSELRFVSLPALERNLQRLWAEGKNPLEEMRLLAGLHDVHYLFVADETKDVIVAGPAGGWDFDQDLRVVNIDSGRPVLRLDDLVVLIRNAIDTGGQFTCSITPQQENLRRTQRFLDESRNKSLKASSRDRWVQRLRDTVGLQNVEFQGLDPKTRVARVLLEADYHMKLIGMGIEPSIDEIPSYLDLVNAPPTNQSVLRWWFALHEDFAAANAVRDTFDLTGQAVQLMSENELLTKLGQRVHTGGSEMLNEQFAAKFTKHFRTLSTRYRIYADLENVCKLAVVAALLRSEGIPEQVEWEMLHVLDEQQYIVPLGRTPKQVPSVVNYRVINGKHIVAGVSGGVSVQPSVVLKNTQRHSQIENIESEKLPNVPVDNRALEKWWWD